MLLYSEFLEVYFFPEVWGLQTPSQLRKCIHRTLLPHDMLLAVQPVGNPLKYQVLPVFVGSGSDQTS